VDIAPRIHQNLYINQLDTPSISPPDMYGIWRYDMALRLRERCSLRTNNAIKL